MDSCTLAALIPSVDQVKTGLSVIGSIVIAASLVTSLTPTPAQGTTLARAYRYLEIAALLFSHAKGTGELPGTPQLDALDKSLEAAIELVRKQPS